MSFIGVIQWDALCSPYGSFIECRWEESSHFSFWPIFQFKRLSCHYADRPKDEISFCRVHFQQIFKKAALNRHRTMITDANWDNEVKETLKISIKTKLSYECWIMLNDWICRFFSSFFFSGTTEIRYHQPSREQANKVDDDDEWMEEVHNEERKA